jgi:iron complex outermembrane receptor protein
MFKNKVKYFNNVALMACVSILTNSFMVNISMAEQVTAEVTALEKINVTADPLGRTIEGASQPVDILSEEDIRQHQSASIGELLSGRAGVHSASFGAAVGRPVIRGLGGARVKVMQNGIDSLDAGQISPDHGVAVDSHNAHQIEILRGPAALIYGSEAVGGAVNVVDNRIPINVGENQTSLGAEVSSGDKGKVISASNLHMFGNLRTSASFSARSTEDYNIPHGDSGEAEAEAHDETVLDNSDVEQNNASIGFAYSYDKLTFGLALSRMEHKFGLPGHGDHEILPGEEEEGEARVDLEQTRLQGQAVYTFSQNNNENNFSLLDMTAKFAWVDYKHTEGHEDDHADEAPTIGDDHEGLTEFKRKAIESRFHVNYQMLDDHKGVFGLQLNKSDFSAQGEEAIVPSTELTQVGVFALHSMPLSQTLSFDVAMRLENNKHDVATAQLDSVYLAKCGLAIDDFSSQDFNNTSISAGFNHQSDGLQVKTNLTRVSRAPATQELYSCGAHESTLAFEIGNPNLTNEESLGLDFGLQKKLHDWQFSGAIFANKMNDFIYLQALGNQIDGLDAQAYQQQDATLQGYEVSVIYEAIERVSIELFSDQTVAKFNSGVASGQYVPRIPAQRIGMQLAYQQAFWNAKIRNTRYLTQDRLAFNETQTQGFDLLSFSAEYTLPSRNGELLIYTSMQNLLNEEVRYHTSFVKDEVLQPGRNVRLGVRYNY